MSLELEREESSLGAEALGLFFSRASAEVIHSTTPE
jgi:hypothetical protein